MSTDDSALAKILDGQRSEDRVSLSPGRMRAASRKELERRWRLVRDHLRSNGLQALVVQGYEEKIGGNVRWLTDTPPGYPRTIIFHADDLMTSIDHGPQGEVRRLDDRDPARPGIGELVTNWALVGGHFTSGLSAESAVKVIGDRGYTDVGIVGARSMPYGFVADFQKALADRVRISDETDFFDNAKASKSEEEIGFIRETSGMQDAVFAKLLDWIKPGVRDFEINAFIDYQLQLLGAERGVYIGVSAPLGKPASFAYRYLQGRTIQFGDHMNVLLESNGGAGQWTELGRLISFGRVPAATREAHEICVEAQALTASLCKAGAAPADIFALHNAFMVKHGSEPEKRLHSHGQGYDAVERPFVRSDETMLLGANMNLSIHPTFAGGGRFATICDNILIAQDGAGEFLHQTPKEIFEL